MNSAISQRVLAEIEKLGGYSNFYSKEILKKSPNGVGRLAHLVPEIAPDQIALARLLAKFAVEHRKEDLTSKESLEAYKRYDNAKRKNVLTKFLAKDAPYDPISWEACEYFLLPENRVHIQNGVKQPAAIPEPIQNLMEQSFRGEVTKPKHTPLDLRKAAIVFAERMTLEAGIKATSGDPCACEIVGKLVGEKKGTVAGFWKERGERRTRRLTQHH